MCPECLGKEWRSKSFGLQSTPTGKQTRVRPLARWSDYITHLAWSRLGVEWAELSEIVVDSEVFRVLLGLLPPRLSPRKSGHENEWLNMWPTVEIPIYKSVFSLFAKSECRIQIIKRVWTETCLFVRINKKYQTRKGKCCWHPKAPPRHPFKYTRYEGLNYTILDKNLTIMKNYWWTTWNSNRLLLERPRSAASLELIIRFILTE